MATTIEHMYRRHKLLLKLLLATVAVWSAFSILHNLAYTVTTVTGRVAWLISTTSTEGQLFNAIWLLAFLMLIANIVTWLIYKISLRRQPALGEAVNDELARRNWLLAFRFAFLSLALLYVLTQAAVGTIQTLQASWMFSTPQSRIVFAIVSSLYVPVSLTSFIGSFLYYDRDR